jgi:hypothetical protein
LLRTASYRVQRSAARRGTFLVLTLPAALSGAPLRVMRTAAGRRALQVALLVGALFALGFLFGEQAQAADGVTSASAGTPVAASNLTPPQPAVPQPTAPGSAASELAASEPVTSEPAVPEPGGPAHSGGPVGDVVGSVSAGLADVKTKLPSLSVTVPDPPPAPGLPGMPGLPDLPALPAFPALPSEPSQLSEPTLPGLPQLPGLPMAPVHTLPAPVMPAPPPGSSSAPTAPPPAASTDEPAPDPDARADAATPRGYGPRFVADVTVSRGGAHPPGHRATRPGYAPVHQAPTRDPGGALSGKAAVDNGTSRHGGDAHAVTFDHPAPLRLMPGATAGVDADGPRDGHRDIPVSPA